MKIDDLSANDRAQFLRVCEAGAASAGRALATFVGAPQANVSSAPSDAETADSIARDVAGHEAVVVAFELSGEAGGVLIHMLESHAAKRVAASLLGKDVEEISLDDERVLGALSEVGNIVASAFLNAISATIGAPCLPSVPDLSVAEGVAAVSRALDRTSASLEVGAIHLDVTLAASPDLHFGLGFIPDVPALERMTAAPQERAEA